MYCCCAVRGIRVSCVTMVAIRLYSNMPMKKSQRVNCPALGGLCVGQLVPTGKFGAAVKA